MTFASKLMRRWLAVALLSIGVGQAGAAPFDPSKLETISLIEVVRFGTGRLRAVEYVADAQRRDECLAEIAALDPEVQTLVWLALFEGGLTEQTEANNFAPPSYVRMHSFDRQIEAALVSAGLAKRAAAFAAATATDDGSGMIDLGAGFGTKNEFGDAIVAFVRAHPTVAAWCETARRNLSKGDRLRALIAMLWRTETPDWLHDWPEPYRVLLLADMFDGEVGNGGVHQYFYNSSGDLAPQAVEAMRALGLSRHAETIERGMSFFPRPYPTDTTLRRKSFDHDGFTDWDNKLEDLTDVVGYDAVRPAMIVYAEQHDLLPR